MLAAEPVGSEPQVGDRVEPSGVARRGLRAVLGRPQVDDDDAVVGPGRGVEDQAVVAADAGHYRGRPRISVEQFVRVTRDASDRQVGLRAG